MNIVSPTLSSALEEPRKPLAGLFLIHGVMDLQNALKQPATLQLLISWVFTLKELCKRIISAIPPLLRRELTELLKSGRGRASGLSLTALGPLEFMRSLLNPQSQTERMFEPRTLNEAVRFVGVLSASELSLKVVRGLPNDSEAGAVREVRKQTLKGVFTMDLRLSVHEIQKIVAWLPVHKNTPEIQKLLSKLGPMLALHQTPAVSEYQVIWESLATISRSYKLAPLQLLADCVLLGMLDGVRLAADAASSAVRKRQKTVLFSDFVQRAFEEDERSEMIDVFQSLSRVLDQIAKSAKTALTMVLVLDEALADIVRECTLHFERLRGLTARMEQLETALKPSESLFWPMLLSELRVTGNLIDAVANHYAPSADREFVVGKVILPKTVSNIAKLERLLRSPEGAALLSMHTPSEALKVSISAFENFNNAETEVTNKHHQSITLAAMTTLFGIGEVNPEDIPSDELASMSASIMHSVQRFFHAVDEQHKDVVLNTLKTRFALALFDGLGVAPRREVGELLMEQLDEAAQSLEVGEQGTRDLSSEQEKNYSRALVLMRSCLRTTSEEKTEEPEILPAQVAQTVLTVLLEAKTLAESHAAAVGAVLHTQASFAKHRMFWTSFQQGLARIFDVCEGFLRRHAHGEGCREGDDLKTLSSLAQTLLRLKEVVDKVGLGTETNEKIVIALTSVVDNLRDMVIVDFLVPKFFITETDIKKASVVKKLVLS